MKLLVSDYDGTFNFFYQRRIIDRNIDAINNFRQCGNLFAISTARSFDSISKETERFNIPYDYLICKNGRDIIDKNGEIIYSQTFYDEDMNYFLDILEHLYGITSEKFYDAKGEEVIYDAVSAVIKTKKIASPSRVKKISESLSFYSNIYVLLNKIKISTVSNKSDAILELLRFLNNAISTWDVYTIGNARNDYEMLRNYQGYKMYLSCPSLLMSSVPFSEGVYSLVKKIR